MYDVFSALAGSFDVIDDTSCKSLERVLQGGVVSCRVARVKGLLKPRLSPTSCQDISPY